MEKTDQQLIEATLAGDDLAYRALIERYQTLVWQLVTRMVPVVADREEICQDVFLKVYFQLKTFRFDSRFSTWLYTVAYRTALSWLRKRKLDTEPEQALETLVADDDNTEQQADLKAALNGALAGLSLDERTVVTLFHLHECSIEDIARVTSRPVGTVKNLLFRIRQKLKARLTSQYGELEMLL